MAGNLLIILPHIFTSTDAVCAGMCDYCMADLDCTSPIACFFLLMADRVDLHCLEYPSSALQSSALQLLKVQLHFA